MCDYSLQFVASRPAKIGDKLVTTKFNGSMTRGFAAVGEVSNIAVCLLPGTEVAFDQEVEYRHSLLPNQKLAQKVARFRQINMDKANAHHDALEFPNGRILLLTRLAEGQPATVLQMPVAPRLAEKSVERQHIFAVA